MRRKALLFSLSLLAGMIVPAAVRAQDSQPRPAPEVAPAPEAKPAAEQSQPSTPEEAQPSPAQDQPESSPPNVRHDCGKNDVDCIGNRKVGGFDIYSIETDIKIGREYSKRVEMTMRLIDDPIVNEFINRIGQNLVRNSDAKYPFTFKIVDADDINAMSLPGGWVYINTGMILAADDEAELAGGMAHEIAHVALRHGTRGQTRAFLLQMLTIPVAVVGGPAGVIGPAVARVAIPMSLLKFSRNFEAEADYFGVEYLYRAGYDPNGLVSFFEKVQAREKKRPGSISKAFATHPQTPDRIGKSQKEMSTILPARDSYIETTSEFAEVRARLAALENRLKMNDANPDKPSLRRRPDPAPDDDDKKNDDRPTLQRHDQNFTLLGRL